MAHFTKLKTWPDAYDDCAARALTGYKGRLAFADSSALYYLLQGISTTSSYIGLRAIGGSHTASTLILSEWAWHEGSTAVQPLTYIPPNGEGVDSADNIYMAYSSATKDNDKTSSYFTYEDYLPSATRAYFCEFLPSTYSKIFCCQNFVKLNHMELFQLV